jgi:hypothetical protein
MNALGPDAEYECVYFNPKLRQMFGLPEELSPVKPGAFVNFLTEQRR